ncbi:MAG: hypothetical protein FWD78_11810 [Treponema sp.]|nr:hypothetical protein [Treponema sp.]
MIKEEFIISGRENIKNEIDNLPDTVIAKLQEFITFQKFTLGLSENDINLTHEIKAASMSSTDFWDNPEDEVWNNV